MATTAATLLIDVKATDKATAVFNKLGQASQEFMRLMGGAPTLASQLPDRAVVPSFDRIGSAMRSTIRLAKDAVAAFGAIAGVGVTFGAVVHHVADYVREIREADRVTEVFIARNRFLGRDVTELAADLGKLAEQNRSLLGISRDVSAELALIADKHKLNGEQTKEAISLAGTLSKVWGVDAKQAMESLSGSIAGAGGSFEALGSILGARITDSAALKAALAGIKAELLELQAKALTRQADLMPLGPVSVGADRARWLAEAAALTAQARKLRQEARDALSDLPSPAQAQREAAIESARKLQRSLEDLAQTRIPTDTLAGQIAEISARTEQELTKLGETVWKTMQELGRSGVDLSSPIIQALLNAVRQAEDAVRADAEGRKRKLEDQEAERSRALAERELEVQRELAFNTTLVRRDASLRVLRGRERELAELSASYDRELLAIQRMVEEGKLAREAGAQASLAIEEERARRMREVNGGFLAGAEDGFERVKERMLDFTAAGRESVGQLAGSVHGSFEDAFVAVTMNTKKAKAAFHDMTRAILSDISRIIARLITMAIWNAIAGGGGSKIPAVGNMSTTWDEHPEGAHGGWFDASGWHGETGPRNRLAAISRTADVRRFAEGGVVTRPTLGLFGEAGPEAFVPLRAGRIPVEMRGQGAGQATVINLTIQAVDASSVERLFHEHGDKLAEVIQGKLGTNRGLINAVRRRT